MTDHNAIEPETSSTVLPDHADDVGELARRMVCEWGMSDAMGPLTFGKKEEQIFLGREIAQHQDYSEDTALKIDQEVKHFVTGAYDRSFKALTENKATLVKILTCHVIAGDVMPSTSTKMVKDDGGTHEVTTVGGCKLWLSTKDGHVWIKDEAGGMAKVTIADVKQSNGVIHVIDHVLLPKM